MYFPLWASYKVSLASSSVLRLVFLLTVFHLKASILNRKNQPWLFYALMVFCTAGPGLGALSLAMSHEAWLMPLKEMGYTLMPLFILVASLAAGLSLVPTHAVSLIAGMLYGPLWGCLASLLSINMAAGLAFTLAKQLTGASVQKSLKEHERMETFVHQLFQSSRRQSLLLLMLIRLSPLMPFALTNLVLAAAKVRFVDFSSASFVGLAPRIVIVALAGSQLEKLDLKLSSDRWILALGIVATLASLSIVGKAAKRALSKKHVS